MASNVPVQLCHFCSGLGRKGSVIHHWDVKQPCGIPSKSYLCFFGLSTSPHPSIWQCQFSLMTFLCLKQVTENKGSWVSVGTHAMQKKCFASES